MRLRTILHTTIEAGLGLALTANLLSAGTLGVAQGYNLYALNNINVSSDIEGSVAFGGVLSSAPPIGSAITTSTTPALVGDGTNAGASNVLNNGGNYINLNGGSAFLAGYSAANHANINFNGGGSNLTSDPIAGGIANSATFLNQLSTTLAGLTPTNTISPTGVIDLSGQGAGTYVVNLTSLAISNINIATNQTLIVNWVGSGNPQFGPNDNIQINGSQQNNQTTAASGILFNFGTSTAVSLQSPFFGTILAPDATVTGNGSIVAGEVIGLNINGLGETHAESIFNGSVPDQSATPEPATLTLLGGSLVGFGLMGRRFLRK